MSDINISRRDFMKYAGLVGGGALVVKLFSSGLVSPLNPLDAVASDKARELQSKHKWVMVIDQGKCIGCNYCTFACKAANDIPGDAQWNVVSVEGHTSKGPAYLPRPCQHCEHAPCVEVCPVGATYHRADGLVEMDYKKCIGCRYCEIACPYNARVFNWQDPAQMANQYVPKWGTPEIPRRPRGVVEKCTFCAQRIDRGLEHGQTPGVDYDATPACVNACPVGARIFGDLNDPNSNVSKALAKQRSFRLREDLGTNPRVYYLAA
jgi:Fe-S-cluster-containing dehydrogenase component